MRLNFPTGTTFRFTSQTRLARHQRLRLRTNFPTGTRFRFNCQTPRARHRRLWLRLNFPTGTSFRFTNQRRRTTSRRPSATTGLLLNRDKTWRKGINAAIRWYQEHPQELHAQLENLKLEQEQELAAQAAAKPAKAPAALETVTTPGTAEARTRVGRYPEPAGAGAAPRHL